MTLAVGLVGRALCPTSQKNLSGINPDLPSDSDTQFNGAQQGIRLLEAEMRRPGRPEGLILPGRSIGAPAADGMMRQP